jgi:hypothetical protein
VTVAASNTTEESQIRVLIDDRVKAVRAKDAVALWRTMRRRSLRSML